MKTFIYIALFIILGSFAYNLISFQYDKNLLGIENQPFLIGLLAGICGLILCVIMLKHLRLKEHLNRRAK
ncbi:MAG TPA: hypothetical protein VKY36_03535 [Moheibacter sp.]|nr:hypothetical protein [Moheibacter sp.]